MKQKWVLLSLLAVMLLCLPFCGLGEGTEELRVEATLSADTIEVGNDLTVAVNVAGGRSPYTYSYSWYVTDENGKNFQRIGEKSFSSESSHTQTIRFGQKGGVQVNIIDALGREVKKRLDFEVTGCVPLKLEATLNANAVEVGNNFTITMDASGGQAPYLYSYVWWVWDVHETNKFILDAGSSTHKVLISPVIETGIKGYVDVYARDTSGREVSGGRLDFMIAGDKLSPLDMRASLSANTVEAGGSLTASVLGVTGGREPYTYSYDWNVTDENWPNDQLIGKNFNTMEALHTQTIKFGQNGYVYVTVKDADGRRDSERFDFTITGDTLPQLTMKAELNANIVNIGNSLTANILDVRGGKEPYTYSYSWYISDWHIGDLGLDGIYYVWNLTDAQEGVSLTSDIKQIKSGKEGYVTIKVEDADGRYLYEHLDFTIEGDTSLPLTTEAMLTANTVEVGGNLTVIVENVRGGRAPYTYSYDWNVKDEFGSYIVGKYDNLLDYSQTEQIQFGKSGNVTIKVKDADGRLWRETLEFNIAGQANGWVQGGEDWYYYRDGKKVRGWLGMWHYFDGKGAMKTGWIGIDGMWYYLDKSGVMVTGEVEIDGKIHLFGADGIWKGEKAPKKGWINENNYWYYYDYENGEKMKGWIELSGKRYYLDENGVMQTGWIMSDGMWYYLSEDGIAQTGWIDLDGTWYYLSDSGAMVTGEEKIDGKTHLFAASGAWQGEQTIKEGWINENGNWYYYKNGKKLTGWLQIRVTRYYLKDDGVMATGEVEIDGKVHLFSSNGAWQGEQAVEGWVNESGNWYYYKSGRKATGWLNISGTWYYLDVSGVMSTEDTVIDGVVHMFNSSGVWLGQR